MNCGCVDGGDCDGHGGVEESVVEISRDAGGVYWGRRVIGCKVEEGEGRRRLGEAHGGHDLRGVCELDTEGRVVVW